MESHQELDDFRRAVTTEMDVAIRQMFEESDNLGKSIRTSLKAINEVMRANGIEPSGYITDTEGL
jgi:hypothetical protein